MVKYVSTPVCLVVALFCLIDGYTRLLPHIMNTQDNEFFISKEVAPPLLNADLKILLTEYVTPTSDVELVELKTDEPKPNESEQKGDVLDVWLEGKNYRLKGVFNKESVFAVLEQVNSDNDTLPSYIQISQNDVIAGYTVEKIWPKSVKLISPLGNIISLKLFVFTTKDIIPNIASKQPQDNQGT